MADALAWTELGAGERAALLRKAAEAAVALATAWAAERSAGGLLEPIAFARTAFAAADALEQPRTVFRRARADRDAPLAVRAFPLDTRARVWASGVTADAWVDREGHAGGETDGASAEDAVGALEQLAAGAPRVQIDGPLGEAAAGALSSLVTAGAVSVPSEARVSPAPPLYVVVAPGPWSAADMRSAARHVASFVAVSAAGVLRAPRGVVLVLERAWLQRERFVEEVHAALGRVAVTRDACDAATHDALRARFDGAARRGENEGRAWTVCPDVHVRDLSGAPPPAGALFQVTVDVHATRGAIRRELMGASAFLPRAAAIVTAAEARDACLFVHGATEDAHDDAVWEAVRALAAEDLGVNAWPLLGRVLGVRAVVAPRRPSRVVVRSGLGAKRAAPWLVDRARGDVLAERWLAGLPSASWGEALSIAVEGARG